MTIRQPEHKRCPSCGKTVWFDGLYDYLHADGNYSCPGDER